MLVASSAPGFATRSRSAKTRFLRAISSNTASITTSAPADGVEPDDTVDQTHAALHLAGGEPAARNGRPVIGGDPVEPLLQPVAAGLDQGDRDAGIGKAHRDAAAHRAGADHGGPIAIGRGRVPSGHARDLGRLALGEEDVPLRLRLVAGDELAEELAFALQSLVEGQGEGVAHGFDAGGGRLPAAQPPGQGGGGIGKALRVGARLRRACRRGRAPAAAAAARPARGGRRRSPPPSDSPSAISSRMPSASASAAPIGSPVDDHPERLLRPDEARQALGAARSRQEPELDLGQSDPRASATAMRKWHASASSKPPPRRCRGSPRPPAWASSRSRR